MKKIIKIIFVVILIFILCLNLFSIFNISIFGYRVFKISSGSMIPRFKVNDLVLVRKEDNYVIRDVITYKKNGSYITHRIIKINNNKYITKGDANNTEDNEGVLKQNIVGKVVLGGKYFNVYFIKAALSTLIILIIIYYLITTIRQKK